LSAAAANTPSLFPETPEERAARVDAEILALLLGKPGGKYGETLGDDERAVLQAIRFHRGRDKAITIREIEQLASLSDRQIKKAVRNLRMNFRVPIAASKNGLSGGYYLWMTADDLAGWKAVMLDQLRAEIALFRAVTSEEAALEIVTALRAEVTNL
jgi:hypothetical protein